MTDQNTRRIPASGLVFVAVIAVAGGFGRDLWPGLAIAIIALLSAASLWRPRTLADNNRGVHED
ncbi:hypothetical protein QOM21_00680 [Streptomyces sp. Pv4-95]|uniref:hypothetical protein n=1 Tax=Streptomyces sp. Pv4-95 TaxID=3049543 RepID=UPI0038914CDA